MLISTNSGLYSARPDQPRVPMAEAMDFFRDAGFDAVDVNFCATIYTEPHRHEPILDGDWQKNLDALLEAIRRNNLTVSHTHLPFYRYDLPDAGTLVEYDRLMRLSIDATEYIGAKYAVIHPYRDETGATSVEGTMKHLLPFRDAARKKGVTLCVENMHFTPSAVLCEIVDRLETAACYDVGHANLSGFDQGAYIRALGKRLKALHLHDNYGTKDDHSLPFLGTVDWPAIMAALRDTGYDGVFNYEVAASKLPMALRMEHAHYLIRAAYILLKKT